MMSDMTSYQVALKAAENLEILSKAGGTDRERKHWKQLSDEMYSIAGTLAAHVTLDDVMEQDRDTRDKVYHLERFTQSQWGR